MPVRIAEVCLAEPAITPFAILGGDNPARLIPRRNALAEYPARLSFFFAWSFSSADVIPEAHLTNSSSRSPHRRLPTAALRPCSYSADRRCRPSHAQKSSGFLRTLSCRPDRKNCIEAWFLPLRTLTYENPSRPSRRRQCAPAVEIRAPGPILAWPTPWPLLIFAESPLPVEA